MSKSEKSLKIVIVSPYPPPNRRHIYGSGVSSYTRNLAEALKKLNIDLHIVADNIDYNKQQYVENGIKVHRVYNKGALYILNIFKELCNIKPNIVHIQHEYFLYGGLISATLFPLLVIFSRLVSQRVLVTMHGVIPLKLIDDEKFRQENGIQGPKLLLKVGLFLITKLITSFAHCIIVHEQFLKNYLIEDYKIKSEKIYVIPHGVENIKPIPKEKAKKLLNLSGKKVVLFFGYLTGYKGLDILLRSYMIISRMIPDSILVVAGGPHPRLHNRKWYKQWLKKLIAKSVMIQRELGGSGKIIFTGFVPEEKISLYYSAADVVVLPYKARIAASGSEALAIAHERPLLIFNVFENTYEIREDILFSNSQELAEKINLIINNRNYKYKLIKYIKVLKKQRKWSEVGKKHLRIYESVLEVE